MYIYIYIYIYIIYIYIYIYILAGVSLPRPLGLLWAIRVVGSFGGV